MPCVDINNAFKLLIFWKYIFLLKYNKTLQKKHPVVCRATKKFYYKATFCTMIQCIIHSIDTCTIV